MIVTDKYRLSKECEKVNDIIEGEEISAKLLNELKLHKTGVALAANQIGINKRVCVLNIDEPLYFINPEIIESSGKYIYLESCLSFKNKKIKTERFSKVTVSSDNYDDMVFEVMPNNHHKTLECIAIQHEIDHLDGKTMYDRRIKTIMRTVKTKYKPNEKITISDGVQTKVIKYKKASQYLLNDWIIIAD
jgi:peptide deformylase